MTNNLKKIREKKKMTQVDICKSCGIRASQEYGLIERGERIPRVDKAIKIARAFNKKVEDVWTL